MNIKSYALGYVTALALSLGTVVADTKLNYDDQQVNRADKQDLIVPQSKRPAETRVPKNYWTLTDGWQLHKTSGEGFCYLTHSKYSGLTITNTAASLIDDSTNDMIFESAIDEFAVLDDHGNVARYYTRNATFQEIDVDGKKIKYYMLTFDPKSRIVDISLGRWLIMGRNKISLLGSMNAMEKLEECNGQA
jgi:hypothetical protein